MTPDQMNKLTLVNKTVNTIQYNAILGVGEPPDFWSDVQVKGWSFVCRMFTEMKAEQLKPDWAVTDLYTIICWTEMVEPAITNNIYSGRERHAVLAVRVDTELWILDSRFDDIYLWTQPPTNYLWEGQQTEDNRFRDVSQTGLS